MEEKEGKSFNKTSIFAYNQFNKKLFFFGSIFLILIFAGLFIFYYTSLRNSDIAVIRYSNSFLSYLSVNIASGSLLGAFYSSFFGGLFFTPIPVELVFPNFLRTGNNFLVVTFIYIVGLFLSFGVNYWVGGRLTYLSKKATGIKQFYKTKTYINNYGGWAIFIFNLLPLPSQVLSVVVGVFRYNKTKFFFFSMLGEAIKFLIISIGYFYIV